MKKTLTKAELDAAESAFAEQAYKDRSRTNKKAQDAIAAVIAGSSQVTIRLDNREIALAKHQAAAKGLKYQTYIKMLLHQALHG